MLNKLKTKIKPKIDNIDEKSVLDWETNTIHLIQQSEKNAWLVAKTACFGFLLSVIAIGLLMPFKESVPYVIRVNDTTGVVDVITSIRGKNVEFDEVQDKYFINQLVLNRESYDYHTLKQSYLVTYELSSEEVFKPYERSYQGKNALNQVLTNKYTIKPEITSITLQDGDTAVVRFAKVKIANEQGVEIERSNWVATIGYKYQSGIMATETQRLINPFGFTAVSYNVVPEMNNLQETGK